MFISCLQLACAIASQAISNPCILCTECSAERIVSSWAFHVGGGLQLALPYITVSVVINNDLDSDDDLDLPSAAASEHNSTSDQRRGAAKLEPPAHPRRFFALERLVKFATASRMCDIITPLASDFASELRHVHFPKQDRWVVMGTSVVVLRIAHLGPHTAAESGRGRRGATGARGAAEKKRAKSAVLLQRRRAIQIHIATALEACPLFHTAPAGDPILGAAALAQGTYVQLPYGDRATYMEVISATELRTQPGVQKALSSTGTAKDRANANSLQEILDGPVPAISSNLNCMYSLCFIAVPSILCTVRCQETHVYTIEYIIFKACCLLSSDSILQAWKQ